VCILTSSHLQYTQFYSKSQVPQRCRNICIYIWSVKSGYSIKICHSLSSKCYLFESIYPSFCHLWEHTLSGLASHICLLRSSLSKPNVKSGYLSHFSDILTLCQMIWLELLSCHPQKLSAYKPSIWFSDCLVHHYLWIHNHLPYLESQWCLVLLRKYCSDHSLFGIVAHSLNLTKQSLHWTTSYLIGTCLYQRTQVQNTFACHNMQVASGWCHFSSWTSLSEHPWTNLTVWVTLLPPAPCLKSPRS